MTLHCTECDFALHSCQICTALTVESLVGSSEGAAQINAALTEVVQDNSTVSTKLLRQAVRPRTVDERVVFGKAQRDEARSIARIGQTPSSNGTESKSAQSKSSHSKPTHPKEPSDKPELIVMASGNLGLIYLTQFAKRATLEEINQAHPNLLSGLVGHPGIGFILVRSAQGGAVVIGSQGTHYLDSGKIEGKDPLADFGPNAAQHVKRTDSFPNVADIMVNGFYDAELDEVAAFEELIGSHGGMGGDQNKAFLMFPVELPAPEEKVVGAEAVYHVFKGWQKSGA